MVFDLRGVVDGCCDAVSFGLDSIRQRGVDFGGVCDVIVEVSL